MSTIGIDVATIGHALNLLGPKGFDTQRWNTVSPDQDEFIDWYRANAGEIDKLRELTGLAATSADPLNDLLAERGFDIRLSPFNGIGVVSILDMLVKWLVPGTESPVLASNDRTYQGFELEIGIDFFNVRGRSPLLRLHTTTGDSLWIVEQQTAPRDALDLFFAAVDLLGQSKRPLSSYRGAIIPEVAVDIQTDLQWLLGLSQVAEGDIFRISQALQQLKFRADKSGAHAEVATAIVVERCVVNNQRYKITQPFLAFLTQKDIPEVPLSVLWVDFDSWQPMGRASRGA